MKHFVFILLSVLYYLSVSAVADDSVVMTKYGPIRGIVTESFRRFQGVPFATPPIGQYRWKNPIPPSPWYDVKDCTNFTIGCAQSAHSLDVPKNTSEDCLYMEIWTPTVGKYSEPAAVMLFFHGGDFKQGGEGFEIYNGSWISSTTNTIVIITDYRLGVFGWLYYPGDPNVGLQDQRLAIRWIQDNAPAFRGDPTKVMIFGQSAGGESVLIHVSNTRVPESKMFTRALVESGPMALNYRDTSTAMVLAETFAYELGCLFGDMFCFQNKTTEEVLTAAKNTIVVPLDVSEAIMMWSPVVTGKDEFPEEPLKAFERGDIVKVPFAIGSNLDDGILFGWVISPSNMPYYEYIAIVTGIFQDEASIDAVLKAYPPDYNGDNRLVCSVMINDYMFLCDSRRVARLVEKAGVQNVYYYQFTRQPPFCPWPKSQSFCCNHVCHGDELAYLFHDTGNPYYWNLTGVDLQLANAMSNYWASFAMYGDPNQYNAPGVPAWPIYRAASDLSMNLTMPLNVVTGLNNDKCNVWDSVGYYHQSNVKKVLMERNIKFSNVVN
eukprot:TRINITY_DN11214_c0_g1_i1.p1 TRINITY_DN11214_c0_g1~~TRINITY_DN11214_c0_g1_i1.p1  ORF type:complete len:548 (-),score=113.73 TRINITY_DN11214_c0_g1_i1:45-1688(-)